MTLVTPNFLQRQRLWSTPRELTDRVALGESFGPSVETLKASPKHPFACLIYRIRFLDRQQIRWLLSLGKVCTNEHASIKRKGSMLKGRTTATLCSGRKAWDRREDVGYPVDGEHLAVNQVL
jgi:hypothetical protein